MNFLYPFSIIFCTILAKRKIYTYHDGNVSPNRHDLRSFLLQLWLRNWYRYGYHPIILNSSDAQKHYRYSELRNHFSKLPTVNNSHYELCCYLRWLAFSTVGGGIMMDYDIYGFSRNDPLSIFSGEKGFVSLHDFVPMISFASNSSAVENFINFLATYNLTDHDNFFGRPHVSDMQMVLREPTKAVDKIIRQYSSPIVHFSYKLLSIYSVKMKEKLSRRLWPNQLIMENIKYQGREILILVPEYENIQKLKAFNVIYQTLNCNGKYQRVPDDIKDIIYPKQVCNVKLLNNLDSLLKEDKNENDMLVLILIRHPIQYFLEQRRKKVRDNTFNQCDLLWEFFGRNLDFLDKIIRKNNREFFIGMLDEPEDTFLMLEYFLGMIFPRISEAITFSPNRTLDRKTIIDQKSPIHLSYALQCRRGQDRDMAIFHSLKSRFEADLHPILQIESQINFRPRERLEK